MRITEISIKLGSTVNLGDYNNTRPEVGAKAAVEAFDDPDKVYAELASFLEERMAHLVDDELERAGRDPRYAMPLYRARYSDLRQCVVVSRHDIELPQEKNWKESDRWHSVGTDLPYRMRYDTAHKAAVAAAQEKGYSLFYIHFPADLAELYPLPDPGEPPQWHVKKLRSGLAALHIPEEVWEQVADLPHVDVAYLDNFYGWYRRSSRYLTIERLVAMLIAGETPWEGAAASQAEDEEE